MSLFSFQERRLGRSAPRAGLGQGVQGLHVAPAARGHRGEQQWEATHARLAQCLPPWPLARRAATHSAPPFLNLPTMFNSMSAGSSGL